LINKIKRGQEVKQTRPSFVTSSGHQNSLAILDFDFGILFFVKREATQRL